MGGGGGVGQYRSQCIEVNSHFNILVTATTILGNRGSHIMPLYDTESTIEQRRHLATPKLFQSNIIIDIQPSVQYRYSYQVKSWCMVSQSS